MALRFSRLLFPVLITTVAACGDGPATTESSTDSDAMGAGEVAFVNGRRIPDSIFRLYTLNSLQANVEDLTDEGHEAIVDRLIYLSLLSQEAERVGLDREPEIAAELELARMDALARHMTTRFAADNPPSESELRDLYRENLGRFLNTRFRTRHILVETEAEAGRLLQELDDGADFATLAREHSTGPTGPDGGDLGWITSDSVVEPFARAIESAEPGQPVNAPVQTQYGWHVILVEERDDSAAPGLDAVRQDLTVDAKEQKLERFVQSLREAAVITTQ